MMALHPCVQSILCGLASVGLQTLNTLIAGYKAQLEALITTLRAELLRVDVLVIPVRAQQEAISQTYRLAQAGLRIVPLQLIAGCADLGTLNVNIEASLDTLNAELQDTLDDLARILSFREELQALIVEYVAIIQFYTEIQAAIAECAG